MELNGLLNTIYDPVLRALRVSDGGAASGSFRLIEGGTSKRLLEDGTSRRLLEP